MSLLDRYIIREIIPPLGLSFLVYTFILLMDKLFDSAEMIIRRGLPVSTVGEILLLALPNMLVLTIPMAFLLGTLLAIGRLSADSEIIALRATGVSLGRLYKPVLILSALLFLLNSALMVWVLPRGNESLKLRTLEIATQSAASQVQPRIFLDDWQSYIVYVFDVPEGGGPWEGVFVAESIPSTRKNQVIMARRGRLRVSEDGERAILDLVDAQIHDADLSESGSYQVSKYETFQHVLEDELISAQREELVASKGVRELTLPEIREWMSDPARAPELRRLARVELHKRFSIPFACVAFGIFALPLGFTNRRGGKAHGFLWAIGIILLYWIMLDMGEKSAEAGNFPPWLAMWGPNILGVIAGLFLLARRNRDKSLMISRIDRWIRRDLWSHLRFWRHRREQRAEVRRSERRARRQARQDVHVVLRLPRVRFGFPSLIDRYLVRSFAGIFVLVLLSCLSIFVVADLTGKADEIMENGVAGPVVASYYLYSLPQMAYDLSPIIVLVATLITFSVLSRANEVTAFKALGVSLFRLAVPVTLAAVAVTAGIFVLEWKVLPASNEKATRLEDRIRGRETVRNYRRADRQWLFGPDRYIYNYLHYDPDNRSIQRLQVFELDPQTYRIKGRLVAQRATYVGDGAWHFEDGWSRTFENGEPIRFERFPEKRLVHFPEGPEYFETEIRPPEQMGYVELADYIDQVERSGQSVPELEVQLQSKIAYPGISLVMALVALPFAFKLGRRGALYGVGLSIILGMIFLAIYAFFTTLGEAGALPPTVAVWSPNAVFALTALYLFLGVRT